MIEIRIPTPLRSYTDGKSSVQVSAETVNDAMAGLVQRFPPLKKHLFNDAEELRPFVNIYHGGEDIRTKDGVNTPLQNGDTLLIIPSIAGG